MIKRSDLLSSPEYWFEEAQNELYRQLVNYMVKENLNQTQLADRLNVTKGYISQILNGNFNYTLKKLIEISLLIGKVPVIQYRPLSQVLFQDVNSRSKKDKSSLSTNQGIKPNRKRVAASKSGN